MHRLIITKKFLELFFFKRDSTAQQKQYSVILGLTYKLIQNMKLQGVSFYVDPRISAILSPMYENLIQIETEDTLIAIPIFEEIPEVVQ